MAAILGIFQPRQQLENPSRRPVFYHHHTTPASALENI
jgi:hypothetical protein